MFVEASAPVPLPAEKAREALVATLASVDLSRLSVDADAGAATAWYDVGPRGVSKRVLVRTQRARIRDEVTIVPIRWEPTGLGSYLFPTLDAHLVVVRVNDVTSVVSIIGYYDAPLGRIGQAIDHAALNAVAQRSVELFVREMARRMESQAQASAAPA
ncbi:MAG TPA: hypothetical protein VHE56_00065 [Mycobacteriales bacterium]|nr:hypothetical protein [Mycobacteriales bacterium]